VTVGLKNRGGIVTRTDALGTYKVPGFGKNVDPKKQASLRPRSPDASPLGGWG
jgi:hypothetical protein